MKSSGTALARWLFACLVGMAGAATDAHAEVVVEWVRAGRGAEAAGLAVGDRLASWRTLDLEDPAQGTFDFFGDILAVERRYAPRTRVAVRRLRGGVGSTEVVLPRVMWSVETRPAFSELDFQRLAAALAAVLFFGSSRKKKNLQSSWKNHPLYEPTFPHRTLGPREI